jgi:alpha-tubulin suppressor-like RCC1 family protein
MIPSIARATAVSVGSYHACALVTGAPLQCWGYNNDGQLGDPSGLTQRSTPGDVPLISPATTISCGHQFTCAALADGTARCWGRNTHGELGDGTTTSRALPLPVLF